jgi:NAD-dependent DNA ligase
MKEIKERYLKLKDAVKKHSYLYHTLDKPEISDEAYDSLLREIVDIEEKYPELKTSDSPTERVGGEPLKEFVKIEHETKQWSFDDAFTFDDLKNWDKKTRNFIEKAGLQSEKVEYCWRSNNCANSSVCFKYESKNRARLYFVYVFISRRNFRSL